ncbi:MAG: cyclic nucleotide-binding domain-containing protein [Alcanivoracaceae bacterium]|jgi:hypothetical protein|nr:cyclic nucleotide-binding domain-containing protein [Alcanivoracaceae bacterium]
MIPLVETPASFSSLSRQYKRLANELLDKIDLDADTLQLPASKNAYKNGMDPGRVYLVKGGMLHMACMGRRLFTWDEGDLVLPDAAPESTDALLFSTDSPALLASYDTLELVRAILANDDCARLWTRLLMTQQGIMTRLLAAVTEEQPTTTPGFAYYQPGDVIIQQGDPADYVFSLFEGSADVLVDDVTVGEVGEGEVLGALALLTNSPRSATVRAKTRCSVVKVPKTQFKHLIRSNPTMIHGLMTDMANQIKKLNTQIVQLSG